MKDAYAVSPSTRLNIFVTDLPSPTLGDGVPPWDPTALGNHGGVMIDFAAVAATGFPSHALTHEVGHALGLWHTYRGISEVAACSTCYECPFPNVPSDNDLRGDYCSDTRPTPFSTLCNFPPGLDSCTGYSWNQVQPDVAVAEVAHVRREQAAPAPEIHQHGAGSGRRRDQRRPGRRQPPQHREGPVGAPPFRGELLVLAHVVAWQCHRHP